MGGAQSYLVQLCRANPYADVRLEVASLHGRGPFAPILRQAGIPFHPLSPARWNPVYLPRLRALLKRGQYDILHAHLVVSGFVCETFHGWLGRPTLIEHLHSPVGTHTGSEYQRLLERAMFRRAAKYIACSAVVGESLVKFKPAVRDKIVTLPNGVDEEAIGRAREALDRDEARRRLGLESSDFVIGSAGRLSPLKNYPLLLRAAALLRGTIQNLKIVIFGAGGEEAALRRMIRELNLEQIAILPGYDPEAAQKLGLLDVFILPSDYEGLPMVLIEAIAAGVPSITTDFASAGEVLDSGRDGLIVPRGNAEALAGAIRKLWEDPAMRERLGAQGRLTVHERFSISRHWQRLREIYQEVVSAGGRS